jgi:plasmid stabilization system protein ParE
MASKVRFHPDAVNELVAASEWYRERSDVAARAFLIETDQGIKNIRKTPLRYPTFQNETRRLVLPRFPFSIIYRLEASVIEVIAVAHHKRKPGYWKSRLSGAG